MFKHRRAQVALAAVCALGGGSAAVAADRTLAELAAEAQFVVHTQVRKIDYRLAEAIGSNGAVPYTVVTYDVLRTVRGTPGASTITLQFIGGPDGQGRVMGGSHLPVFQVGDEDVLFVRDNGTASGCALAGCVDGRYRLLRGLVHDGMGVPARGISDGKVVVSGSLPREFRSYRYPRPGFDALLKNPAVRNAMARSGLTPEQARRAYEAQPDYIEMGIQGGRGGDADTVAAAEGAAQRRPVVVGSLPADAFMAAIEALPRDRLASAAVFVNADPEARIVAPSAIAASPAQVARRKAAVRSAEDLAEERALPADAAPLRK